MSDYEKDESLKDLDESLFEIGVEKKSEIEKINDRIEVVQEFDLTFNVDRQEDGKQRYVGVSVRFLSLLITFMNRGVLKGRSQAFDVRLKDGKIKITPDKLALWIKLLPIFARLYDHRLGYSPELKLFFECYREHEISDTVLYPLLDLKRQAEIANSFIAYLRSEAKRINVLYRLKQWMRNGTENRKKIRHYLKALFSIYARIVVVRIDLHLSKESLVDDGRVDTLRQDLIERLARDQAAYRSGIDLDGDVFDADALRVLQMLGTKREDFLHQLRRKYGNDFIGYVWTIEFSASGHYHLHLCAMFDGSKVDGKHHVHLADQLGSIWKVITKGKGYAYVCNREKYDRPACGEVNYHDAEKIGNLIHALDYLAKNTQLVRVKGSKGAKMFNTGEMPEPRQLGAPGRPRRKPEAEIDEVPPE